MLFHGMKAQNARKALYFQHSLVFHLYLDQTNDRRCIGHHYSERIVKAMISKHQT